MLREHILDASPMIPCCRNGEAEREVNGGPGEETEEEGYRVRIHTPGCRHGGS